MRSQGQARPRLAPALLLAGSLLFGAAVAQTPIRFQTWHLGEEPWGTVLHEMKDTFEQENPDISIEFDRVTYGDKEMIFTTQSAAASLSGTTCATPRTASNAR